MYGMDGSALKTSLLFTMLAPSKPALRYAMSNTVLFQTVPSLAQLSGKAINTCFCFITRMGRQFFISAKAGTGSYIGRLRIARPLVRHPRWLACQPQATMPRRYTSPPWQHCHGPVGPVNLHSHPIADQTP